MSEQDIQQNIIAYLSKLPDTWVIKTISTNKRGCPDILASIGGQFYAFEVKTPKGRVAPIQQGQLDKIKETGGRAFIVRSVADVVNAIHEKPTIESHV